VCAEERRELSLPAAAGGLKTMGYGRMATYRPGGVLPGGHSPSVQPFALILEDNNIKPEYGIKQILKHKFYQKGQPKVLVK
jgi:hypothetical protein